MPLYLIRHAKAGDRVTWEGDDRLRPLDAAGQIQARALVHRLANFPISAILSSPYRRCLQTVEPLARARHLEVLASDDLAEGAGADPALRLAAQGEDLALCSHGDVIDEILERLIHDRVIKRSDARSPKGSTWILRSHAGRIMEAAYLDKT